MLEDNIPAATQFDAPDTSEPLPNRQAELRAAYVANISAGNPPYLGVDIHNLGEILWIIGERHWSSDPLASTAVQPMDLSRTNLSGANLNGIDLDGANLSGAMLVGTKLRAALLIGMANLEDASLVLTDLSGAALNGANLASASLRLVDLSGADLREVRMNSTTLLQDIRLDTKTRLCDVVWGGVPLTRVDWSQIPRLGDEQDIAKAKTRKDRIIALRDAARAYRGLSVALRSQGLLIPASNYRLREERLERKALWHEHKFPSWLFSAILDRIAGYGERPQRTVIAYLFVLSFFTFAYLGVAHFRDHRLLALAWWEWPALSISAFHGRGFFPTSLPQPPSGWITLLALAEAVIGLFIELVFISGFTRRFLGNS